MQAPTSSVPVIDISNVSVKYNMPSERINSLKEVAIRRLTGTKITYSDFYALSNINLQIMHGEAVALVGKNGAGKSTLLKLISQVQRPTRGRVIVRGKISPMIELGSGFHPELTGRENIFLNGAMMGHSYLEMSRKLNNIIEFSELGDFIDSPIRTYSSGMIARLGFSIAAEIDPEILIIDEVLAVGDESFQSKCISRMRKFHESGITVLFVSHALDKAEELCPRAIWLDGGKMRYNGPSSKAIQYFRESMNEDVGLFETRQRQIVVAKKSTKK